MNRLKKLGGYSLFVIMAITVMGFSWAEEGPYLAEVQWDKVDVMSGAGKRVYYKMGELKKGDEVTVVGRLFGWYRVECPQSTFSYVSKAFVDMKGNRKVGVVNKNGTEVKAGMMNGKEGDHSRVQLLLNEGDTVEIVDEIGSLYKIVPPASATAFIEPNALRPMSTAMQLKKQDILKQASEQKEQSAPEVKEPVAAPAANADAKKPSLADRVKAAANGEKKTSEVKGQEITAGAKTPAVADANAAKQPGLTLSKETKVPAKNDGEAHYIAGAKGVVLDESNVSKELKALDEKMQELMKKKLEDQPLDVMIAAYEKMLERKDVSDIDKEVVKMRVEALKHNQQLLTLLATIEEAEKPVPVEVKKEEVVVIEYDAVGQLLASAVYDGTTLPRMYRLVDPASNRTLVYVKPGDLVDGRATLGRLVGIVGSQRFDQSLKLNVISVEKIDVLEKTAKK